MELRVKKKLFAITVTAPTFLSLGLIGIIKNSEQYFQKWNNLFCTGQCPDAFEWWAVNACILFMTGCLIGIECYLNSKQKESKAKTITPISYSNMAQNGADQILSSVVPWLTVFADDLNFCVLFFCVIIQCGIFTIASYNNSNYNMLCSILGYRYYEVHTEENTYILLSKRCIKNKGEITKYAEINDYMGLILNK